MQPIRSIASNTLESWRVRTQRNPQDISEHGCCCSSHSNCCSSDNKPDGWLCPLRLTGERRLANHLRVSCSGFFRDTRLPYFLQIHQWIGTTLSQDPVGRKWFVRPSTNLTWSHHPTFCTSCTHQLWNRKVISIEDMARYPSITSKSLARLHSN